MNGKWKIMEEYKNQQCSSSDVSLLRIHGLFFKYAKKEYLTVEKYINRMKI